MATAKDLFGRRIAGRETVLAILTLLAVAGVACLGWHFRTQSVRRARLKAAGPSILAQARQQRAVILAAIEGYREAFGVYPPDNIVSRSPLIVDPFHNALLYELSGVSYNSTNTTYRPGPFPGAAAEVAHGFFRRVGFMNCRTNGPGPKDFLYGKQPVVEVRPGSFVYLLAFNMGYESSENRYEARGIPWNYVSSCPTNNPGGFDLWLEVPLLDKTYVIGNWEGAK